MSSGTTPDLLFRLSQASCSLSPCLLATYDSFHVVLLPAPSVVACYLVANVSTLSAVMATQQVSASLTAPRIFQRNSVKSNKALQSFGPLHRSVSRTHNFAYNPVLDGSEAPAAFKFVRPDCPPDVAESSATGKAQQSPGSQSAVKQVRNTARSALEQVKHM